MNHHEAAHIDVLVVDDEEDIRELLEFSLLRMGLTSHSAECVTEARELLDTHQYRLCLTDMRLPDGDGLELVEWIQSRHPNIPVAIITAFGSIETAIRALKLGAFDFVTKPLELKALKALVSHALSLDTPQSQKTETQDFIGSSSTLSQLRHQIEKLARNQAPVFIYGESGTGKEVVARLIHNLGARSSAPFVPVNCGAISPELMESEFFGHRKGSFTGATSHKEGLFQAAKGGTLFLDEIGELPLPMQVKLLRAIQERAVRPVGAHAEEAVDVRILSASHRDLAQLVSAGTFRQDLFFRINVITLNIPPLRNRTEDIPELAAYILNKLARRESTAARTLSPNALEALCQYPFPGNVRELENLLERACALSDRHELQVEDLGLPASETTFPPVMPEQEETANNEITQNPPVHNRPQYANDDEQTLILQALDDTRWNRSAAARKLGITLRQLRYRLEKWGID